MSQADLEAAKRAARTQARRVRAVAAAAAPQAAEALVRHLPASLLTRSPVAGYWPAGAELDPRPLMARFAVAGAVLALPRAEDRDGGMRFLAWREGDPLAPDAFGLPAPLAAAPPVMPAVVLTPLLAFDRTGARLGQGAGAYDRALAALRPAVVAVGVAYAAQEVAALPLAAHDERLDWVLTEREAIACAAVSEG
jgi:5-formyltetrahydrofolate cyclo-ligase